MATIGAKTELFARTAQGAIVIADEGKSTGEYYWVSSDTGVDDTSHGMSPEAPFETLAYAVTQVTSGRGDTIYVMPCHAETVSSAVTVSAHGLSIIGQGRGPEAPLFTVTGSGIRAFTLSGDGITIKGLRFTASTSANAAYVKVTGSGCVVDGLDLTMNTYARIGVELATGGDNCTVRDLLATTTANGPTEAVKFANAVANFHMTGCRIVASDGTNEMDNGCVNFNNTVSTNPVIVGNVFDGSDDTTPMTVIANAGSVVGGTFAGNMYAGRLVNVDNVTTVTANIADGAITAAKFASGAITADVIAADAIAAAELANGAIDADTFANGAITAAAIATGAIDADAIAADAVTEIVGSMDGTTTDSISGKLGTDTEMADRSLFDLMVGDGPTAFPTAAAPANDKCLGAVLRDIWDALRNGTGGAEPGTNRSVMDYLGVSPSFYVPGLGYRVSKSESIADDTTGVDLYTVTGQVLITNWTMEVTTDAVGADLTDYKLRIKTDNVDLCAATDIHGAAVGRIFMVNSDAGDNIAGSASGVKTCDTNGKGLAMRIVGLAGGSCVLQSTHGDPNTSNAVLAHDLFYLPLEADASVAAA